MADEFQWTDAATKAAQLLAEGMLTEQAVAAEIGLSRSSISRWKREPEFQARIREIRQGTADNLRRKSELTKSRRVLKLERIVARLDFVMRERATEHKDAPGGKSGLMVREVKSIRVGKRLKSGAETEDGIALISEYRELEEYKVDAAMLKEYREHLKQIAIERGEWTEKKELSGPDGGPIRVSVNEMITKIYGGSDANQETASFEADDSSGDGAEESG